jgi:hypothetical protein
MFSAALDEWLPRFTPGGSEKPQLIAGTNGTAVDSGKTSGEFSVITICEEGKVKSAHLLTSSIGSKDTDDKDNSEKSGASRIASFSITGVVFAMTSVMFLTL